MKKNYLKLVLIGLGMVVIASSCLKTEELDSVKQMRQANADKLKAQANAQIILNRYDSLNNSLKIVMGESNNKYNIAMNLYKTRFDSANAAYVAQTNKANADYTTAKNKADADYYTAYKKAQSAADVAYQNQLTAQYNGQIAVLAAQQARDIEQAKMSQANYLQTEQSYVQGAKNDLINDQITYIQNVEALYEAKLQAKTDSINFNTGQASKLYNDYFAYYNGGTLTDGTNIANGIFTLKGTILTEKNTLLGLQKAQVDSVKAKADLINSYRSNIRIDSLKIVDYNKLITIYQNAKTAADYTTAIASITSLVNAAETDYVAKDAAYANLIQPRNAAYDADTAATRQYTVNNTQKASYTAACNTILSGYSNSYNTLTQEVSRLAIDLTDKQAVLASWQTSLNSAYSDLNTANNAKNNAQSTYDKACAVTKGARLSGVAPTAQQITDSTNAYNTLYTPITGAVAVQTAKQNTYNSVEAQFNTAKTNLTTAQTANDSVVARKGRYDIYKPLADAADAKVATLKATMDAKVAAYVTAQNNLNVALANKEITADTYTNYKSAKTTIEGLSLLSDVTIKFSALDDAIATQNTNIATSNNKIADYKSRITFIGSAYFKYQDAMATSQQKIDYYTAQIAEYVAAATAIKAQIDKL